MKETKDNNIKIFKNNRGITLVSLVITIVLMIIVASTTVYTSYQRFEINNLNKMINDIELLTDKVSNYYLKYNDLPILKDNSNNFILYTYTTLGFEKNQEDNENYYILDLGAMEGITLNYGKEGYEAPNESDDVYIINEVSHAIYYVKGVETNGVSYHSLKNSAAGTSVPPTTPEIKIIGGEQIKIGESDYYFKGATLELIPGTSKINDNLTTTYKVNDGEEINISTLTDNTLQVKSSGTNKITLKTKNENEQSSETDIMLKVINVGDYIDYNHNEDENGNDVAIQSYTSYATANASEEKNEGRNSGYSQDQTFNLGSYTGGWRLLDVEDGQVKLVASNVIDPDIGGYVSSGKNYYTLTKAEGYQYGVEELNAICSIFGQGKWAISARSINVDDINEITGYDPKSNNASDTHITAFGNKITYYWDGTDKPYYETINGESGNLTATHNTFYFFESDENGISPRKTSKKSTTATVESKEKIVTLERTAYTYYIRTDTNLDTNGNEWKVLFNDRSYWLASRCIDTKTSTAEYGMFSFTTSGALIKNIRLISSDGGAWVSYTGVRPIVYISKNIELAESSENSWTIVNN